MPAFIPLNNFKTVAKPVPYYPPADIEGPNGGNSDIQLAMMYRAPRGVTSIILLAQAANLDDTGETYTISLVHFRPNKFNVDAAWNDENAFPVKTYLLRNALVPPNDSLLLLPGKLVLETHDRLYAYASAPSKIDIVLSILETANQ
jgi:hypothetical protein